MEDPQSGVPEQPKDKPEDVEQRYLACLNLFATRARRVEEHSLASDKDQLLAWAQGAIKLQFGSSPTVSWDLPDEEALDSLAARCRPFVLKGDPVHYGKVSNALGYFVRSEDDPLRIALSGVKAAWQKLDPDNKDYLGYESSVGKIGAPLGTAVTDKALAYAWLYGDLVHADSDIIERVGEHDIDSRFQGGVLLIANVAVQAIATLNLLRSAEELNIISLEEDAFTRRVTARSSIELPVSRLAVGPVGTSSSDLHAALDALDGDR